MIGGRPLPEKPAAANPRTPEPPNEFAMGRSWPFTGIIVVSLQGMVDAKCQLWAGD